MPKFEIVSLDDALEATKSSQWLEEKFGVELEEVHDSSCALAEPAQETDLWVQVPPSEGRFGGWRA